jgi:hypothetical protein
MGLFDWLFKKKSPADLDVPPPRAQLAAPRSRAWKSGDRVLASWVDALFYPGRVRATKGNLCEIAYDDGDAAWVHQANVREPDMRVGSAVLCRAQGGPAYWPGVVEQQNGEKIRVKYDNGEHEWTTISMVRVQRPLAPGVSPPAQPLQAPMTFAPGMPAGFPGGGIGGIATATMIAPGPAVGPQGPAVHDVGEPVADSNWRVGDRVLGRWFDLFWYPATVLAVGAKGYHLLFDDGDQRVVQDLGLMPLVIEEGEDVFIRQKNQPQRIYTPGRVLSVRGEMIDVELEDGTHEPNHKVSRGRFWRCPVGFTSLPFDEGDRVWAQDIDSFTYPAEILSIDHDKVIVQFLDGPERMLTPELIKPFGLKVGALVTCRWKAGQVYFPGRVSELDGDRIHIAYDDGDREWTTVRLLRLPPANVGGAGTEFRPGAPTNLG